MKNKTFIIIFNNNSEEEMVVITIDGRLTLKVTLKNVTFLCKKAAQKIGALLRLLNHLNDYQKILIFDSIEKSQFCPFIWMFYSSSSSNMINKIDQRAPRLILNDYANDFATLLQNKNEICNHHGNIQTLIVEI